MSKLSMFEGIGESYELKLKEAGILRVEDFLSSCNKKRGRKDLAEKTGIPEKLILKWCNHADLARVKGVGGQYAELLEASGVDTVPELAKRKPENLYKKMIEVNNSELMVKKLPALSNVENWIKQAASLPRILEY